MATAAPKPEMGGLRFALMKLSVRAHAFVYRLTDGRIGGEVGKSPILLLTTRGRKSGVQRTTPLIFLKTEKGYAITASNAGADRHPAWYLNLNASPEAEVQVLSRRFRVTAQTVDPKQRAELWPQLAAIYPPYIEYEKRTTRTIPVVELLPI